MKEIVDSLIPNYIENVIHVTTSFLDTIVTRKGFSYTRKLDLFYDAFDGLEEVVDCMEMQLTPDDYNDYKHIVKMLRQEYDSLLYIQHFSKREVR